MALNIAFISAASAVQRYLPHSRGQTSVGACMLWFETIGAFPARRCIAHPKYTSQTTADRVCPALRVEHMATIISPAHPAPVATRLACQTVHLSKALCFPHKAFLFQRNDVTENQDCIPPLRSATKSVIVFSASLTRNI